MILLKNTFPKAIRVSRHQNIDSFTANQTIYLVQLEALGKVSSIKSTKSFINHGGLHPCGGT